MVAEVAIYSGLPALAVRHCHEILRDMKENNNLQVCNGEVAIYSGLPALAVRHCHDILRDMKENNNLQVFTVNVMVR